MVSPSLHTLAEGFAFPESPRWHEDQLWFVDIFGGRQVLTTDMSGNVEVIRTFNDHPSGIGFLPDQRAIVVLMGRKQVARIDTGEIYADLSFLPGAYINDMVVDQMGRAYIGYSDVQGVDHNLDDDSRDAIMLVDPDGSVRTAIAGGPHMHMPNGMVLSADGMHLIAAMPLAKELVRFTIRSDGSLDEPEVYAGLGSEGVDGMCLDAEGAIWAASPRTHHVYRVLQGGEVTQTFSVAPRWAVACMLGGPDGRTLFVCTAEVPVTAVTGLQGNMHQARGSIDIVEVDVPRAGRP
jgi:sugar lactone lactonase YvrE